jgi:hypothetical protein
MSMVSSQPRWSCAAALLVAASAVVLAQPAGSDPPLVGQPAHFSGAVGQSFQVQQRVQPARVRVEQPLTLTVRVVSAGLWKRAPERPKLEDQRAFTERFYIEKSPSPRADRVSARDRSWEFDYRLRPKSVEVQEVPSLLFVYYRPGIQPPSKGYQTVRAEPVPITVVPAAPPPVRPIEAPDFAWELAEGPAVLEPPWAFEPSALWLLLVLLAPPVLCGLWYAAWSLCYPDAARRSRQRRSRAAQRALTALGRIHTQDAVRQAEQTSAILAEYLHDRFDLPVREPTPVEAAECLRQAGAAAERVASAAALLEACDRVRFTPSAGAPGPSPQAAADLIVSLEAETWPGQSH